MDIEQCEFLPVNKVHANYGFLKIYTHIHIRERNVFTYTSFPSYFVILYL